MRRLTYLLFGLVIGCAGPSGSKQVSEPATAPGQQAAPGSQASAVSPPADTLSPDTALRILADASAANPNVPSLLLEMGLVQKATGDRTACIQTLTEARRRFPTSARIAYHLGATLMETGQPDMALDPLRSAVQLQPQDLQIQVTAGYALSRASKEFEAKACAEAAIKIDPDAPEPYLLLANIDDRHGTAVQAVKECEAFLARSAQPGPGYLVLGRIYSKLSDAPNSEKWLKLAVETLPQSPEAWLVYGQSLFQMQRTTRLNDAIAAFERSRDLEPNRGETHMWLGRVRLAQGRAEDAVLELREAIRLSPNPMPIFYDLGQALNRAGLHDEANAALKRYEEFMSVRRGIDARSKVLDKNPKDWKGWLDLGNFLISSKQYKAAVALMKDAELRAGPNPDGTALRKRAEQLAASEPK